jgi:hypothetical protein
MLYDTNNPMLLLANTCTYARTTRPLETAATEAAHASHGQCTPAVQPSIAKKSRNTYKCGVCGRPKRGHFCPRQPSTLTSSMPRRCQRSTERTRSPPLLAHTVLRPPPLPTRVVRPSTLVVKLKLAGADASTATPPPAAREPYTGRSAAEPFTDGVRSARESRTVKLVMRDYLPSPPARRPRSDDSDCFCAQPDCPACFPISATRSDAPTPKRAKQSLGEALRALVGHAPEPPSELDALARIRAACAGIDRTLASLAMLRGPTGATESDADTASTGESSSEDDDSDDEDFTMPINGGRGRFHRVAP